MLKKSQSSFSLPCSPAQPAFGSIPFILFLPIQSSYKLTPNTVRNVKNVLAKKKINTNPQNSLGAAPTYIINELRSNQLKSTPE